MRYALHSFSKQKHDHRYDYLSIPPTHFPTLELDVARPSLPDAATEKRLQVPAHNLQLVTRGPLKHSLSGYTKLLNEAITPQ